MPAKCPSCNKAIHELEAETTETLHGIVVLAAEGVEFEGAESVSDSELYRCPLCTATIATSSEEAYRILSTNA